MHVPPTLLFRVTEQRIAGRFWLITEACSQSLTLRLFECQTFVVAHLLLVDDDNDLVETLGELLRIEGHEVRTAPTGDAGLKVLRAAPLPDAIVLDVDMPVLGGPGMAHEMLLHDAGEQNIPIILMSARHDLPEIAGRMGTPYFLAKPGRLNAILKLLERALLERRAPSSA